MERLDGRRLGLVGKLPWSHGVALTVSLLQSIIENIGSCKNEPLHHNLLFSYVRAAALVYFHHQWVSAPSKIFCFSHPPQTAGIQFTVVSLKIWPLVQREDRLRPACIVERLD